MLENQHDRGRREGKYLTANLTEIEKELPFHLVGAGCDFYQYPVDRPFGYPVYQWIQTISGTGVLVLNGREIPVPQGYGMLLFPGEPHAYHVISEPWYVNWITVNGYHIESMLHYKGIKSSDVYAVSEPPVIESHIRKAFQLLSHSSEMNGLDGSVAAYQILIDLFKYVWNENSDSVDYKKRRLELIMNFIEENLDAPLSIEKLAEKAEVTPQYFCEIFKEETSQRPVEYINQRRIERAKELMIHHPFKNISEIASMVGFGNNNYFSRVFKNHEGVSPKEYRNIHN